MPVRIIMLSGHFAARSTSTAASGPAIACAILFGAGCLPRAALSPLDWPVEVRLRPGEEVVLDGSSSFDPEGERLSFRWRQSGGPPVELRDADTPWPRFVPSAPGRYEFELVVTAPGSDGDGPSASASPPVRLAVEVLPPNRPPEIRLEKELRAEPGQWTVLDGGGATDPDGDALEFRWELVPDQAARELVEMEPFDGRARRVRVRAWKTGEFRFRLFVRDAWGAESSATVTLRVAPRDLAPVAIPKLQGRAWGPLRLVSWPHPSGGENSPPRALATASILESGEVLLDGMASSDPDGDSLEYRWTQVSGPPVRVLRPVATRSEASGSGTCARPGLSRVAFEPPSGGRYVFRLTVSDGLLEGAPYELELDVPGEGPARTEAPHAFAAPPGGPCDRSLSADAGPDIVAEVGQEAILDGSRSRGGCAPAPPGGRPPGLLFDWRQVAGPRVLEFRMESLGDPGRPRFVPREPGRYEFALRVSADGETWSDPDFVTVTALAPNRPPLILASERARCLPGEEVLLSATGLDPDGDEVSLSWRIVSGKAEAFSSSGARAAVVASSPGVLVLEVLARDSRGAESRRRIAVEVAETGRAPVASVRELVGRRRVVLDGTGSYDPEGGSLRYRWDVTDTTLVKLGGRTLSRASFVPPGPGRYEFVLQVGSGARASLPARIAVEIEPPASAGISVRGARRRIAAGSPVILDGSASRQSGGRSPLLWRQVSGPEISLPGEPRERLQLRPLEPGLYVFRVELPGAGTRAREVRFAVVERNAAPVARAEVRVDRRRRVVLDGSRSRDPEGDPLSFAWVQTAGPSLGLGPPDLARSLRTSRRPGDSAPGPWGLRPRLVLEGVEPGSYRVRLLVTDGERVARSDELAFEVP